MGKKNYGIILYFELGDHKVSLFLVWYKLLFKEIESNKYFK